jgi:DNA polymerase I
MKALIDGDVCLYTIGFTTQDTELEIAYYRLDDMISNILTSVSATDYQIFISDSRENNYRYHIDKEYKANRTQEKPKWFEELKEYIISRHNAKIAYGMEADDLLAITHNKEGIDSSIICTIDKDLKQVPGLHYSWPIWRKDKIVREGIIQQVTPEEGINFFWQQMLIGDVSDNIKGITGIGPVKASKLLDITLSNEEQFNIVKEQYKIEFGDLWKEQMEKTGSLLWIKRNEEETYKLPY